MLWKQGMDRVWNRTVSPGGPLGLTRWMSS